MTEYRGQYYTLSALAEKAGIKKSTLKERIKNGWDIEDAVNKPVRTPLDPDNPPKSATENRRKWRHNHIDKRNKQRRNYYEKHRQHVTNGNIPYTLEEIDLIMKHEKTDVELSRLLGRSVQAIQIARNRYKRNEVSK